MKRTGKGLMRLLAIGLVAAGLGLTGCKSSGDRTLSEKWGDHQVAKNVEKELSHDAMFKYPDVKPVVHDAIVQLTGFVDSPEQRQRAAELATRAKGVREVVNGIQIKPTPTGRPIIREAPTNAPAAAAPTAPSAPSAAPGSSGQAPASNP
jgi:hyperosmotically inducible periplasmic protein